LVSVPVIPVVLGAILVISNDGATEPWLGKLGATRAAHISGPRPALQRLPAALRKCTGMILSGALRFDVAGVSCATAILAISLNEKYLPAVERCSATVNGRDASKRLRKRRHDRQVRPFWWTTRRTDFTPTFVGYSSVRAHCDRAGMVRFPYGRILPSEVWWCRGGLPVTRFHRAATHDLQCRLTSIGTGLECAVQGKHG
jgi:hypothetical protein